MSVAGLRGGGGGVTASALSGGSAKDRDNLSCEDRPRYYVFSIAWSYVHFFVVSYGRLIKAAIKKLREGKRELAVAVEGE